MAFFRSLKSLIRNPKKSRTFLLTSTLSSSSSFTPISRSSSPSPSPHISRTFFSNWIVPSFHGPHGSPWKGGVNVAVLEKSKTLNFSLLQNKEKKTSSEPELASGSGRPEKNDSDDFVNVPNFISLSRMVSGPLLGWMIINDWYSAAMVGLAVSGATDWLDGYVARRMKINSVVGSYLDPLADKVLIGCVALAMVHKDLLHPGLVGIIVLRDVGLVGGAVYLRASSLGWKWKSWSNFFNLDGTLPQKVEPLFISKVNTVFQLMLVAAALLQPEFGTPETQSYVTGLSWLVASTTMTSTGAYLAQHVSKLASTAPKC